MAYFVDHDQKKIHWKSFAGDRCGFIGTPAEQREFTDSSAYVEELMQERSYRRCPYCKSMQVPT
ncbi:hypothetical protein [Indiicoccus explosivorum]|uniref:hypothetical protein n=1 Tax=Indiicoccus explosivorum TaxID=1917864 RepID=UPI000B454429|nr:hypothetical protein [Indiicoccus explosivorum]